VGRRKEKELLLNFSRGRGGRGGEKYGTSNPISNLLISNGKGGKKGGRERGDGGDF